MTQVAGKDGNWLYASCADNTLWKLNLTNDSKEWSKIGNAINVVSLASHNGWLYCLDRQQGMWQMDLYGPAPQWLPCEGYKQGRLTAISTFDGARPRTRPTDRPAQPCARKRTRGLTALRRAPPAANARCCAVESLPRFEISAGVIYGATKDHKLVKRQIQGTGWSDANAAKQVIGLACFKHRIYAACSNNLIWSFDM
jgi:hypothetical protein